MLRLMKLEIKKNKFGRSLRGVAIANIGIIAFLTLIYLAEQSEGTEAFANYQSAFAIIDIFVRATFMMFASVWISKLVIEEYKNKTISLMFMYPINRKKIMASKLAIVFIYTFLCVVGSNLVISLLLYGVDQAYQLVPEPLTKEVAVRGLGNIFISALSTAGMSLIPLFFGMLKKSVPATIVAALLLNTVVTSNWGEGASLYSVVAVPLSLAAVGIYIAFLSIRKINSKDLS
jgi:ABC-type transport system involved in multi-copper enzyme maturation permease subunit